MGAGYNRDSGSLLLWLLPSLQQLCWRCLLCVVCITGLPCPSFCDRGDEERNACPDSPYDHAGSSMGRGYNCSSGIRPRGRDGKLGCVILICCGCIGCGVLQRLQLCSIRRALGTVLGRTGIGTGLSRTGSSCPGFLLYRGLC